MEVMLNTLRRFVNRRLMRDTCGAEIAETAAILPLLFLVLLAIFWFGQAYRIYGTVTHAARAGARAAVAPACTTCAPLTLAQSATNAQTAVQNALIAANVDPKKLVATNKWTTPAPALCICTANNPSTTCGTPAVCDATVTNVCVQENVQLSDITGGMGTCGTSVSMRYQYPYHFRLPLTTLDLGNLQLPGQAEMRAENQ